MVTKDHSLSAQWEHTILVTKDGYEVLTLRTGEEDLNIVNPNTINFVPVTSKSWVERLKSERPKHTARVTGRTSAHPQRRTRLGFNQGDDITGLLHGWAAGVDAVLTKSYGVQITAWISIPDLSLIAVGGYGRQRATPRIRHRSSDST